MKQVSGTTRAAPAWSLLRTRSVPRGRLDRRYLTSALVIAITAFGLLVRLWRIGELSITGDEEYSIRIALGGLSGMLDQIAREAEPHPPLYYVLLAGWIRLVGHDDLLVRLPNAFIAAAAIPLIARLGTKLAGPATGLIAALLLAVSPLEYFYSQQARMYALGLTATLAAVVAYLGWLEAARAGRRSWSWGVVYLMAAGVALYSHYFTGFFLGALQIWSLADWALDRDKDRPPGIWPRIRLNLIVALLYLPWIAVVGAGVIARYGAGGGNRIDPITGFGRLLPVFAAGWSLPEARRIQLAAVFGAAFALGLFSRRRSPRALGLLLVVLGLPPLAVSILSFFRTEFHERYVLFALPYFLILVAAGGAALPDLVRPRPARLAVGLLVSLVLAAVTVADLASIRNRTTDPVYMNAEFRPLALAVAGLARPRDGLLFEPLQSDRLFNYYYPGALPPEYGMPPEAPADAGQVAEVLMRLSRDHDRLWFVVYTHEVLDPQNLVETWLQRNLAKVSDRWYGIVRLVLFSAVEPDRIDETPWRVEEGGEIRAWGWRSRLEAGDALTGLIRLAPRDPRPEWRVAGALIDAEGRVIQQVDTPLAGDFPNPDGWRAGLTGRFGAVVPPGTVPGTYRLEVRLYDGATGKPLTLRREGSPNPAAGLPLVEVRVDRPAVLPVPTDRPIAVSPGARIFSVTLPPGPAKPGQKVAVRATYTQATDRAVEVAARLIDPGGAEVARSAGSFAARQWRPENRRAGELIADYVDVTIPATARSGDYRVGLEIDGRSVPAGTLPVVSRPRAMQAPKTTEERDDRFGDVIRLAGADRSVAPGQVTFDLSWNARRTPDRDWTVFVHLLGPDGRVVAQHDGPPDGGNAPTSGWLTGEYVTDRHVLAMSPGLPAGRYQVEVGLYDPRTNERLPLDPGRDNVLLDPVEWPG